MVMTAYTPTTNVAITQYMDVLVSAPANVPRLDYDPITGQPLGLLIESASTNLLTYSGVIGGTNWSNYYTITSLNLIISPDGTTSGSKIYADTTNNFHCVSTLNFTFSVNTYTISVYAKKGENNFLYIRESISDNTTIQNSFFNLSTGTLGTIATQRTGTITDVGNGWYRCAITVTAKVGTSNVNFGVAVSDNTPFYTGDGFSGIYLWGAQLEYGYAAIATSYIPTTTTTVYRDSDKPLMIGTNFSSWYNQSQGTIQVNCDYISKSTNLGVYSLNNGSGLTRLDARTSGALNSNNGIPLNSANLSGQFFNRTQNKIAISYVVNSSAGSVNGSISTYTLTVMPVVTELQIGGLDNVWDHSLHGHIRKISYYPVALSSANLQALTS